jgi:hypothetical protein
MSKKLIAAVVVFGGIAATVPFYLSGHFAQQAMAQQMKIYIEPYKDQAILSNETVVSGLYSSSFSYDFSLKMDDAQMALVKEKLGVDELSVHVDNQFSHGFLKVDIDTSVSGALRDKFDEALKKLALQLDNSDKQMFSLTTNASFSLGGGYEMNSNFDVQGFTATTTNDLGETVTVTAKPMVVVGTVTPGGAVSTTSIDNITIGTPDSTVSINQLSFTGDIELSAHNTGKLSMFGNQDFAFKLASIDLKGPEKEAQLLNDLNWGFKVNLNEGRATLNNTLSVAKAGSPDLPPTQVEDLAFNFTLQMGEKALEAYYEGIQTLQTNPDDPAVAMALFAKILTEKIGLTFNSIKAKTFAGAVDITANIDMVAVDADQFKANPMIAIQGLKYAAQGELPKDLLLMTGQLPRELIDNLLQQQMIELVDGQVIFKMTGEAGHVNLNGKPLM